MYQNPWKNTVLRDPIRQRRAELQALAVILVDPIFGIFFLQMISTAHKLSHPVFSFSLSQLVDELDQKRGAQLQKASSPANFI